MAARKGLSKELANGGRPSDREKHCMLNAHTDTKPLEVGRRRSGSIEHKYSPTTLHKIQKVDPSANRQSSLKSLLSTEAEILQDFETASEMESANSILDSTYSLCLAFLATEGNLTAITCA
jgi:hypothetical protein